MAHSDESQSQATDDGTAFHVTNIFTTLLSLYLSITAPIREASGGVRANPRAVTVAEPVSRFAAAAVATTGVVGRRATRHIVSTGRDTLIATDVDSTASIERQCANALNNLALDVDDLVPGAGSSCDCDAGGEEND